MITSVYTHRIFKARAQRVFLWIFSTLYKLFLPNESFISQVSYHTMLLTLTRTQAVAMRFAGGEKLNAW